MTLFFVGHPIFFVTHHSLQIFKSICADIGVLIADEQTMNPSHILTFLGIEVDTINFTMQLPTKKLN